MDDKTLCASLNYEAEYKRLEQELKKATDEAHYLRQELKFKEEELKWHYGFRSAVELIFGKGGCNG